MTTRIIFCVLVVVGLLLFVCTLARRQTTKPSSVVILNDSNFTAFAKGQKLMLVNFYVANCSHCLEMDPHYQRAARMLQQDEDTDVTLASIDAGTSPEIRSTLGLERFPELLVLSHERFSQSF